MLSSSNAGVEDLIRNSWCSRFQPRITKVVRGTRVKLIADCADRTVIGNKNHLCRKANTRKAQYCKNPGFHLCNLHHLGWSSKRCQGTADHPNQFRGTFSSLSGSWGARNFNGKPIRKLSIENPVGR